MKRSTATILTIVGAVIFVIIVGFAFAAFMFASNVNTETVDERAAAEAFDAVRKEFAGAGPVFELTGDEAVARRKPPGHAGPALENLHVMTYDEDDQRLVHVTVPYWLVRLKSGPIAVAADTPGLESTTFTIRGEELERYGRALLLDHTAEAGARVLVWQR